MYYAFYSLLLAEYYLNKGILAQEDTTEIMPHDKLWEQGDSALLSSAICLRQQILWPSSGRDLQWTTDDRRQALDKVCQRDI